jgi:hypothetical protein
LVDSGVFSLFPHPIYIGFASRPSLRRWRRGLGAGCGWSDPEGPARLASGRRALRLFVQIPWAILYETIARLGVQRGSLDTRLPVWAWTCRRTRRSTAAERSAHSSALSAL